MNLFPLVPLPISLIFFPGGGYTSAAFAHTEDRATLGSDLSAGWDFSE
jgi:hypothetical protein